MKAELNKSLALYSHFFVCHSGRIIRLPTFVKATIPGAFSNWVPSRSLSWSTCYANGTNERIKHLMHSHSQKQCPCHERNPGVIQLLREKNKLAKASAEL